MTFVAQDLVCETTAPHRARHWVGDTLRPLLGASGLVDDAALCADELVTNALKAGCAALTVTLRLTHDRVRVSVVDDAPGVPEPRQPAPDASSGRGLLIVAALSVAWGCTPFGPGKEVWADLLRGR